MLLPVAAKRGTSAVATGWETRIVRPRRHTQALIVHFEKIPNSTQRHPKTNVTIAVRMACSGDGVGGLYGVPFCFLITEIMNDIVDENTIRIPIIINAVDIICILQS